MTKFNIEMELNMKFFKLILKKLLSFFKKENQEFSSILNLNIDLDIFYYKTINSRYENFQHMKETLKLILEFDYHSGIIKIPKVSSFEEKSYFGFEFFNNVSEEDLKNFIIQVLEAKKLIMLLNSLNEAEYSVNSRKIQPHIINMEIFINNIKNILH